MGWKFYTAQEWNDIVDDYPHLIEDSRVADLYERYGFDSHNPDNEAEYAIHQGDLEIDGDFKQPSLHSAIIGNVTVKGQISTQEVNGYDGNATLIIIGDLACESLVNDWASIIFVSGNLTASSWVFAAREDSSLVIGKNFQTPIFIGSDIWAEVGGTAKIEYGQGMALPFDYDDATDRDKVVYPEHDWRELALKLELTGEAAVVPYEFTSAIDQRIYDTGTIFKK